MGRLEQEPKIKKLALIGASCVGKTSILDHFRKSFEGNPNVAFVEEAATRFFNANPHITDRFSKDTQGKIQEWAFQDEQEAHASGARIILCDRSVLDAVSCVRAKGDKKGSEELYRNMEFWLPTYNAFLLLDPVGVPYIKQGVRQEEENERQEFHNAFLELFEETGIPYELLSGTEEERIQKVTKIIKG